LGGEVDSDRLVEEIKGAAGRISELVGTIKSYSHMDRSTEHKPTDVPLGVDNTLKMLGHKLKEKEIRLVREYQATSP
jgi:signal transduction histidine kinase